MPRIDNTSELVVNEYGLHIDRENQPVDLCNHCFTIWECTGLETDHPNYEYGEYYCRDCGDPLYSEDD